MSSGTCLALIRVNRRCRSVLCETIHRYYSLRLLHIFLILPVITGCTGWYSFLLVLSMEFHTVSAYILQFQHGVQLVIRQIVKLLVGLMPHIFFFTDVPDVFHNHTVDIFFSTVFCNPSGHFVKIILYCILLFPVKSLSMFR